MAKMTKSQFIAAIAEKTGQAKKDVVGMLDSMVAVAYDTVKKLGEVTIPGLGKLVKKHRPARMGRNPATGEVGGPLPGVLLHLAAWQTAPMRHGFAKCP